MKESRDVFFVGFVDDVVWFEVELSGVEFECFGKVGYVIFNMV